MDLSQIDPALLAFIPVHAPPPGVVSNFDNPASRAHQTQIAIYVSLSVMIIPLVLRIYTRARITRTLGSDDYLAVASAISVIGYCGLLLWMLEYPLGRHEWDVPVSRLTTGYVKANMASLCVYALACIFVKCTLLVLYLRIFRPSSRANILIWSGIVFVVVFYVGCSIAYIILFVPRPGGNPAWGVMTVKTSFIILDIASSQGVVGCIQDLYILVIPIHMVLGLRLPLGRKIGVSAIFLTGLLASICSIVGAALRFVERNRDIPDSLWESIPVYTLSIVELNIGIICSCFPVIVVLFKDFTKSPAILSLRRFIQSRYASGKSDKSDIENNDLRNANGLPDIPKGTISGLRTFVRKFNRTQKGDSTEMTDVSYLVSRDESYHEVLKANR